MYIRRKMYSIGYDEDDLYEVEQRAFSNGFACAERLFATYEDRYGKDADDENYLKRLWKYGFGNRKEQKERMDLLKAHNVYELQDALKQAKKYGNKDDVKQAKKALDLVMGDKTKGVLSDDQEKLRKALRATKYGKAAILGGGALGAGALGYGAYKASQD